MQDVQNLPANVAILIDRVGVRNIKRSMIVQDLTNKTQHTVGTIELSVDLPATFKGTHMSRFIEAIDAHNSFTYSEFKILLTQIQTRLQSSKAHLKICFPYFVNKKSPATKISSPLNYNCSMEGELKNDKFIFFIGVEIPVMTVCPCSMAISENGAHSQRAIIRIQICSSQMVWFEELIAIGEKAASSPVYSLLKREDEKFVTEKAFANPLFVEDVVRNTAQALQQNSKITGFKVEVESMESIHNHDAYAYIDTMPK